jgi:hypothetical protein
MPSLRSLATAAAMAGALVLPSQEARAQAQDGSTSIAVHDFDPKTGLSPDAHDKRLDYLTVGALVSLVGGYHHATGLGLEGSWMAYPTGRLPALGYGAFLQAQLYDEKYVRTAAGAQFAAGPAGAELGLAFRQTDGTYASTVSFHGAVFLSLAYIYIAIRLSPQLFALPSDQGSFGFETALTIGFKVPIAIQGQDPTGAAIQAASSHW